MSGRKVTRKYGAADKKAGMTVSELWEILDEEGNRKGARLVLTAVVGFGGQIKEITITEVPRVFPEASA
jgi:hypothetical protein